MTPLNSSRVPPGFRFHPTDEELVGYYLQKKVASKRIDLDVIHEIDLYKLEPWDLHERCKIGSAEQNEWYFFSHKDKKYPTGTRTNRATAAGFWKATGRDKAIHAKYKLIGMRKTLVFYKGRAPNGQKTDWIMHEYRLEDEINTSNSNSNNNNDDGWVVCRVFKKRSSHKLQEREMTYCYDDQIALLPELESPSKFITDFPYQSVVSCKQEFESAEFHSVNDPFCHQLPQLESPRIHAAPLPTFKGLLPHHLLPPPPTSFCLPPPAAAHFQALSDRLFQHHQQQDFQQAGQQKQPPAAPQQQEQQQPFTDWRMVDKIVAAQLSNEGDASSRTTNTTTATTKERFSDSTPPPTQQDESDDHSEDVALLLRLSKQDVFNNSNNNNSSVNDGDLWSFHGR